MVASMVRRSDERLRFIAPIEARVASIATVPPRRRKAAMRQQQRIPKTLPFYRRLLNERRRMEAARGLVAPTSTAVAGQASASGAAVPSETAASASVASETPSERPTDEVKRRKLTFTAPPPPPPPPPILPTSAPISDAPRTQFVYKTVTKVDRYGNKRQQLVRMPSN